MSEFFGWINHGGHREHGEGERSGFRYGNSTFVGDGELFEGVRFCGARFIPDEGRRFAAVEGLKEALDGGLGVGWIFTFL